MHKTHQSRESEGRRRETRDDGGGEREGVLSEQERGERGGEEEDSRVVVDDRCCRETSGVESKERASRGIGTEELGENEPTG